MGQPAIDLLMPSGSEELRHIPGFKLYLNQVNGLSECAGLPQAPVV